MSDTPISIRKDVAAIQKTLRKNGGEGVALLMNMVVRAERIKSYEGQFVKWLENGSTLLLRELAKPWGWYFDDLKAANQIDAIDSARANL